MPTIRQKKLAEEIAKNLKGGLGKTRKTMGQIMLDAGYSKNVSETPSLVIKKKGFADLLQEYFPDDTILKLHKNLASSVIMDQFEFPLSVDDKTIKKEIESMPGFTVRKFIRTNDRGICYFWKPDLLTQDKALDKLYKITGRYTTKVEHTADDDLKDFINKGREVLPD